MTCNKTIPTLLLGTILTFASSIPVFADSAPNNVISDSAITTMVKAKLLADPAVSSLNISVNTTNGVVTMAGNVKTNKEAAKAIQLVESTTGVKDVNATQLNVQQSPQGSQVLTDSIITAKIKGLYIQEKLFGNKPISAMTIHVETKNRIVNLTGTADNKTQAKNAERIAKSVNGVKSVSSNIQYKNG